MQKYIIIRKSI